MPQNMETFFTPQEAAAHTLRVLTELVELAGQSNDGYAGPMLELQFDGILTRTTFIEEGDIPQLAIAAFLPHSSRRLEEVSLKPEKMLWDAGEGKYVMLRQVPAVQLPDERSLMDAILDTYDQAKAWLAQTGDVPVLEN